MASYSNVEIKVKGILRTALSAEASTTTIDVDFYDEDDPSTAIDAQTDTLMFEIDPLNKTGKGSELILATSITNDTPQADRTRLNTVTRGLTKEGHEQTGAAARAKSWDPGTEVAVATGVMAKMVNKLTNEVSTIAPNDAEAIKAVVYADATARDAAITAPENGMIVYNTATGKHEQYIGGAWADIDSGGTFANASTTVAGKLEEATDAEVGAGTATGGTGARLAINPGSVVKSSSGAGDENKLAALNASGQFDAGFLGTSNTAPTGSITAYAATSAPSGWLLCDGSSVSNDTYSALLDVLNDDNFLYGVGTTANAFTADSGTDTFTDSSHGLSNGERVYVRNSGGALPAGLTADTIYFIISATTNTFQLSTTSGGSAVSISDNGTGTQNWYNEFKVPDLRGNVPVGKDGSTFNELGDSGGAETHTLTTDEMPAHTHTFPGDSAGGSTGAATASRSGAVATTSSTGGGSAHNNLQPYLTVNYIIKT